MYIVHTQLSCLKQGSLHTFCYLKHDRCSTKETLTQKGTTHARPPFLSQCTIRQFLLFTENLKLECGTRQSKFRRNYQEEVFAPSYVTTYVLCSMYVPCCMGLTFALTSPAVLIYLRFKFQIRISALEWLYSIIFPPHNYLNKKRRMLFVKFEVI